MRAVSQVWGALNSSRTRRRRFVIEIDLPSGSVYIASHGDIDTPVTPLAARLQEAPKISSQKLNPDEGRATIGSMAFSAVDVNSTLTAQQRLDLLVNDQGWRKQRVKHWSGFAELDFADYVLEDTQLLDGATYREGVWSFRCRDIQRELRKKICDPVVMHLAQPLDATSTTIEVFTSSGLEAVEHGASYSDAPSLTVAYVKIDDEIIRVPEAGIGATQLTNCVRGVLGTRAAEHTTDESKGSERGKKVTEVIYLELPVPKLVYALCTGFLIGQAGTLPDHWHLGITGDYIRLGDFQNIGEDLYDQADDTLGIKERYILTKGEDGKRLIEKEILSKYGMFMPVHTDGQLGLRRGQSVLSGAAVVGEIGDRHLVEPPSIDYDMPAVINDIEIAWNEIAGEPSRFLTIVDQTSVDTWGDAPQHRVVARGLTGSIHTDSRVRDIYEGLRDRYSGPPIRTTVAVHTSQSLYEVGDVIRLRTSRVRDFTSAAATTLDRPFEVQGVTKDLGNGVVRYDLFASTQRAGPLPPLESQNALPDSFYTSDGTDIAGLAGVVDTGSELQLPNGLTLTGASSNRLTGAIYYATKDVRVPSGSTVNYTANVQLRIRGVLQIDGELNGEGAGLAGVADTVDVSGIPQFLGAGSPPVAFATQAGQLGYFGTTQGDGGIIERVRRRSGSSSKFRAEIQSLPATITQGSVEAIPSLNVRWGGSNIRGVPADLRGTSGGPGGLRHWDESRDNIVETNRGGTGGAGGAGLLVIARGMVFGASGRIVSSGADGSPGVRNAANQRPAWSGGGAGGAPGATVILLDGASSPSPVLSSGSIIADNGTTPPPGDPSEQLADAWITLEETRFGPPEIDQALVPANRVSYFESATSGRESGIAAARFFFLLPDVEAEEDTDDVSLAGGQDISLGITEAFEARVDPAITTLLATITENTVTAAYSHANIYVRGVSAAAQYRGAWTFMGPAEPELEFELPADGETYNVRAVPVLMNGVEAATGVEQQQIVSEPGLGLDVRLGRDIRDEAGNVLSDEDVRNDQLVVGQLSALNANPTMSLPRRNPSGQLAPASWWRTNSGGEIRYADDTTRDVMQWSASAVIAVNAAFPVNADTEYEFVALVRRRNTTGDVTIRAEELDTDLTSGMRAVGSSTLPEPEVQARTRLRDLGAESGITTTFTIIRRTYTPTATARWASMSITGSGDSLEVEWAVVRERSTRNTGALADEDDIGGVDNVMVDGGTIRSGKTTFDSGANGFWIGIDSGVAKFIFGNAGKTQEISWDGSALRILGALLVDVDNVKVEEETYSSSAVSPQTTSAGILLAGDGRIQSREGIGSPSFSDIGYWLGNGASRYYEVRMDVVSGSFDGTSDSTGVWLDWSSFSTNRQWVRTRTTVGTSTAVGDLSIRRASDGRVVMGPVRITLQATMT